MVNYTPPPKDLSRLNPVQRYMQKGSLDWADWLRLGAIILAYWLLRPYYQRFVKKWSGDDVREGEQEAEAYKQRRVAAAVGANDIRSAKQTKEGPSLGELLDQGSDAFLSNSTGAATSTNTSGETVDVKNRKKKSKGVSFATEKSEIEKTLDWEDESEFDPRKKASSAGVAEVEQNDITRWIDRWDPET